MIGALLQARIRPGALAAIVVLLAISASAAVWGLYGIPSMDLPDTLTIGTAAEGGTYDQLGQWLDDALTEELGLAVDRIRVVETDGTRQNLTQLADGELDLAIVQSDAEVNRNVATIGKLYDEYLHVLVNLDKWPDERPPRNLLDLRSRPVALGPEDSGTRMAVEGLLRHYGIYYDDAFVSQELTDLHNALDRFHENQLDAVFLLAGIPNETIERTLREPNRALLGLDDHRAETPPLLPSYTMTRPETSQVVIPAKVYGEQPPEQLDTVAVTALLVARHDLDPSLVRVVAELLYDPQGRAELARVIPGTARYIRATTTEPTAYDYHPGLVRFVREGPLPTKQLEAQRRAWILVSALAAVLACFILGAEILRESRAARARRMEEEASWFSPKKHDVFISYSTRNPASESVIKGICAALDSEGLTYWYAKREMRAGTQWARLIPTAIREARCALVFLMSEQANDSEHCQIEVTLAREAQLRVLPFFVEDAQPTDLIRYHLAALHQIHAYRMKRDEALAELVEAVQELRAVAPDDPSLEAGPEGPVFAASMPVVSPARRFLTIGLVAGAVFSAGALTWTLTQQGARSPGPTPVMPADGTLHIGDPMTLEWSHAAHVDGKVSYVLQVREASEYNWHVYEVPERRYALDQALTGPLEWRVRAVERRLGGRPATTAWSHTRTLTYYPDTLAKITATGRVRVAVSEGTLFGRDRNGAPSNAELQAISLALDGLLHDSGTPELVMLPWGATLWRSLGQHEDIDLMAASITIKEQREQNWGVTFTVPVVSFPPVFVHRQGQPVCVGRAASASTPCRVGVIGDTTHEQTVAERFSNAVAVAETGDNPQDKLLDGLMKGEYSAVLVDQPQGEHMRRQARRDVDPLTVTPLDQRFLNDPPVERIGIATKPGDEALRATLNQAIDAHREELDEFWSRMR